MTAKEYLNRIRFISAGLRVKEQELQQLESDLYAIRSVDTSRERIDGGDTGIHGRQGGADPGYADCNQ